MKIDKKLMNEVEELWVGPRGGINALRTSMCRGSKSWARLQSAKTFASGYGCSHCGNYHHYMLFRFDERNLLKRERLAETRALSFIFPVYFAFPAISLCFALIIIYDSVGIVK